MDAASAVLKKTSPSDGSEVVAGIKHLLSPSDALSNGFSSKTAGTLPFAVLDTSDATEGEEKPFLLCHYNKAENCHRSPWTNRYYANATDFHERDPSPEEQEMKALEMNANEVWESYVQLYYGKDAVGSVYLKPKGSSAGSGSFEGLFGVQKGGQSGTWNSVHIVTVAEPSKTEKTCDYSIESAACVVLQADAGTDIGCRMQKDSAKTCKVRFASLSGSHLENLGRLIEDVEIDFRSRMERVDIPKTMEVIESIYRKRGGSRTAHLFDAPATAGAPAQPTGMGVGSGMIGEIANRAKAKGLGSGDGAPSNPFMAALSSKLQQQNDERAASKEDETKSRQYSDAKSQLRKNANPLAGEAMAALKKRSDGGSAQYNSLKAGLKKREPGVAAAGGGTSPGAKPTPEFMDFRSKLKKASPK
eukprot:CAMPEP_0119560750 /NCGR_PEP_ID=MMETSP1352-20130426/15768_1 /TAXON_ID=265584 /ORGANISM="Stauroneis constricta, Strain CCMP1120" /LENGTH=416 /DNA_ID=CAMNT_0007608799 /DNA_START=238 /DNA_END=1488 /DNA_ORIENTATION=+